MLSSLAVYVVINVNKYLGVIRYSGDREVNNANYVANIILFVRNRFLPFVY